MAFCENCGQPLKPDALFCENCGRAAAQDDTAAVFDAEPSLRRARPEDIKPLSFWEKTFQRPRPPETINTIAPDAIGEAVIASWKD